MSSENFIQESLHLQAVLLEVTVTRIFSDIVFVQ